MPELDSIDDFRAFDAVVRTGGLSAAARELAVSAATISRRLQRIEAILKVRLVQRNTRKLMLTAEGQAFARRCREVLNAVEAAGEIGASATLRGVIRITATAAFAQRRLAPVLSDFMRLHPDVELQVIVSDRQLDLLEQRIDIAFRQAPLGDGRYTTRKLGPDALVLCASPDYLARCGVPEDPADLAGHACLVVGDPPPREWTLIRGERETIVAVTGRLGSTDGEVVHAAALAGAGIVMKSSWDVIDDLASGALVRVLPQWQGPPRALRLVFPAKQHRPERVDAFVAYVERALRPLVARQAELGLTALR